MKRSGWSRSSVHRHRQYYLYFQHQPTTLASNQLTFVFIASPFQIPATESNRCEMLHSPGVRVWSVHFGGSGAGWSLVFCDIK